MRHSTGVGHLGVRGFDGICSYPRLCAYPEPYPTSASIFRRMYRLFRLLVPTLSPECHRAPPLFSSRRDLTQGRPPRVLWLHLTIADAGRRKPVWPSYRNPKPPSSMTLPGSLSTAACRPTTRSSLPENPYGPPSAWMTPAPVLEVIPALRGPYG